MQLPNPSSSESSHSASLKQLISQEIYRLGPISFARFMELALYMPKFGYYMGQQPKLGPKGDFLTAPEISSYFGRTLAYPCQAILEKIEKGAIFEIGAGTGRLACDLILALEKLNALPDQYIILEISPDLKQRQKTWLASQCPHLFHKFVWTDTFPIQFKGVMVANEVLDALPVHCFQIKDNQLFERRVDVHQGEFIWRLMTPSKELKTFVDELRESAPLPCNYQSEVNFSVTQWTEALIKSIAEGAVILFDYGYGRADYYHPERTDGTLMCYYQHLRQDNPFIHVGLQDISVHVDFTRVAEAALNAGGEFKGYTTQANFLMSCGLLSLLEREAEYSPKADHLLHMQTIKKLIMPSQMGELIKVIAFSKGLDGHLLGFSLPDRRCDL